MMRSMTLRVLYFAASNEYRLTRLLLLGMDLQKSTQVIGVIGLVGNEFLGRLSGSEQLRRSGDVGDVAAGQQQCVRTALIVEERVYLGRPATA